MLYLGFPGGSAVKNLTANGRDAGLTPGSERSPGEGTGNLLQYSCLKNYMDRGTWQATVHGVAKNSTWLSDWACTALYLVFRVIVYNHRVAVFFPVWLFFFQIRMMACWFCKNFCTCIFLSVHSHRCLSWNWHMLILPKQVKWIVISLSCLSFFIFTLINLGLFTM